MLAWTRGVDLKQLLCMIAFCVAATGQDCPSGQKKDEATLIQIEHRWAEALEKHDTKAVDCILSEGFEDAGVEGELNNRQKTLDRIPQRKPGSNKLSELTAHVYGETAYVRGLNTVTDPQGNMRAKVRFTDIFVYRDGRWRAVAGHETLLSSPAK